MGENSLKEDIAKIISGDVLADEETLKTYSKDASLFSIKPKVVVFPKNTEDVKRLVIFVQENQEKYPGLNITGRAAGSDMTGGPLNDGIILDFTKYFKKEEVDEDKLIAEVEPGVFYRDFEEETLPKHISMPTYPASKKMAAFGGMIMNNCGGEKTLRYGQMRNFVNRISMVLADGNLYNFSKISLKELENKKSQKDFEGHIYTEMHKLLEDNYDLIKKSKPGTSKNSAGYALWDIYNKEEGYFDLSQLFVGSQGTLGLLTSSEVKLVKNKEHSGLVALFFDDWGKLPKVVNKILPHDPESLEAFDDTTMKLGIRFMPKIAKNAGMSFFKLALKFWPEFKIGVKMLGLPKLIVLVQISEDTPEDVRRKIDLIIGEVRSMGINYHLPKDNLEAEKYWLMRRESFNLLRQSVKGKRTAPFVEDFCVKPDLLPEFLPKAKKLLEDNDIKVNIAGHAGNGNFHIIPLMDLEDPREKAKIVAVSKPFYELVKKYGGTITAEHNDGIIRTPFLKQMYGSEMYELFEKTKEIFDPNNIFNPGKKVGGTIEDIEINIK